MSDAAEINNSDDQDSTLDADVQKAVDEAQAAEASEVSDVAAELGAAAESEPEVTAASEPEVAAESEVTADEGVEQTVGEGAKMAYRSELEEKLFTRLKAAVEQGMVEEAEVKEIADFLDNKNLSQEQRDLFADKVLKNEPVLGAQGGNALMRFIKGIANLMARVVGMRPPFPSEGQIPIPEDVKKAIEELDLQEEQQNNANHRSDCAEKEALVAVEKCGAELDGNMDRNSMKAIKELDDFDKANPGAQGEEASEELKAQRAALVEAVQQHKEFITPLAFNTNESVQQQIQSITQNLNSDFIPKPAAEPKEGEDPQPTVEEQLQSLSDKLREQNEMIMRSAQLNEEEQARIKESMDAAQQKIDNALDASRNEPGQEQKSQQKLG